MIPRSKWWIFVLGGILMGLFFCVWWFVKDRDYKRGLFGNVKDTASSEIFKAKTTKSGEIQFFSDIEGYKLDFGDKKNVDDLLNEVGFWEEGGISDWQKPNELIKVQELEIGLVRDEEILIPIFRQKTEDGQTVASVGVEVSGDEKKNAKVLIYIWEQDLADEERRGMRLKTAFFLGLYGLSPKAREGISYSEGVSFVLKRLDERYGKYASLVSLKESG